MPGGAISMSLAIVTVLALMRLLTAAESVSKQPKDRSKAAGSTFSSRLVMALRSSKPRNSANPIGPVTEAADQAVSALP